MYKDMDWGKKPAIVRYIGCDNEKFTTDKYYEAFFLEYWEGKRDSLHVRDNEGMVTDFNHFEDFEIVVDEDNVLNNNEAIILCITHKYDTLISGLTFGEKYKAIGCDKDGLYLVMDDSLCCYFYPADFFIIINDEHEILTRRSVYYSHSGDDEIRKN